MNAELSGYAKFFMAGQWVSIDIPLPDDKFFRDQAQILSLDHDLIVLQMSRDMLPEDALFAVGSTLEIKLGKGASGFRCRAMIVEENNSVVVPMRLVGEVISNDLREYFRLDVTIPLSYSVSESQVIAEIQSQWQENLRRNQVKATLSVEDSSVLPLAANLSGGGLRIKIREKLERMTLVDLRLYLPTTPPRTINVVGEVVYFNPIYLSSGEVDIYDTAMRFVLIDEKDRNHIIRYIFKIQTKQIVQIREDYSDTVLPHDHRLFKKKNVKRQIFLVIVLLMVLTALIAGADLLMRDGM